MVINCGGMSRLRGSIHSFPLNDSRKKPCMNTIKCTPVAIAAMLVAVLVGCSNCAGTGESHDSDTLTVARGEHDRDGGEHGGEGGGEHGRTEGGGEGEESGVRLALADTYDEVRNGARLVLAYDPRSKSFAGMVQNTTDRPLQQVRVEVHLSNGTELGPTTPLDLDPGQKRAVQLAATGQEFDGWTAHPEVGSGEHGHGEEGREGEGEHR